MATSVSSAVCGLSSLTLSSSCSCAPTPSVSLKSAFSVSLPKCFHVAASVQHRKKTLLFAPRSSISVLKDDVEESSEEIRKGYESLYGPAFSKLQTRSDDQGFGEKRRQARERSTKDGMEEKVVQIRRVTKVVKGGKQLSFRAIVVVGDKKGRVGVGVGKAKEVITAVQKSAADARRHAVVVPMTKQKTFPHRADGKYGAAKVMLRPAAIGTGVIAGGSVRVVLELAGVINALGKELGSKNPLNNARATIEAISSMMQFRDVAEKRGIPMEELWK